MENTKIKIKKQSKKKDYVSIETLGWMDEKLTDRFIYKAGITDKNEITHIKFTIWDFLAELEEKIKNK